MISETDYRSLQVLYQEYSAALDFRRFEAWPEFFTDDGEYILRPRENYEMGMPLATLWLESKAMMKDRVFGITETLYHETYHQHHIVESPLVTGSQGDIVTAEAAYLVHRTYRGKLPEILNLGRYVDRLRKVKGNFLFERRLCIFDNDLIPNSIIYPV